MFKPKFNKVLVEIDDKEAKWGDGNDESMLGASYREGIMLRLGPLLPTKDYPDIPPLNELDHVGEPIMWHEGTEAGTVFEEDGKKYGLIYWWDIIGVKDERVS